MHRLNKRTDAVALATLFAVLAAPVWAQGPRSVVKLPSGVTVANSQDGAAEGARDTSKSVAVVERISVVVGQTTTLQLPDYAKTILNENSMLDTRVNKNDPAQLIITALDKPGIANVTVIDRAGNRHQIEVTVTQDVSALQHVLSRMFPTTNVEVVPINESSVMIFGQVEEAGQVDLIDQIAGRFYESVINAIQVVGSQQVQVRVMVAEVSRTRLRNMGFNFLYGRVNDETKYLTSTIGQLVSLSRDSSGAAASGLDFAFSSANNIMFGKLTASEEFRGFLQALNQEGLAKVIAHTSLVTFSGRAANMIVGGEFPIIVPGQQGTFTVEFREFGNKLDIVPTVLGAGRLRLEVRPELSELDFANGVVLSGFIVPGIKTRRADTSIELNSGETFVIAGLISTIDTSTTNKVPYLGDIPLLGTGFRTMQHFKEEKELIIMVTPELAEPLTPPQLPCGHPGSSGTFPSNEELFFMGKLEVPVCNACEVSRRAQLPLQGNYSKLPSNRVLDLSSKATKASNGVVRDSGNDKPSQPAQPGLIGPVGFEGGR